MKAICPKNLKHKRFLTTAHVMQEWVVDEHGNFIKCADDCLEVTEEPSPCNVWHCNVCMTEAKVTED